MKTLHIKCYLPYNWWHFRTINILNNNNLITRINNSSDQVIVIDDKTLDLNLKIDFYNTKIILPPNKQKIYIIIFCDIKGSSYIIDSIKSISPKFFKMKNVSENEFNNFNETFYLNKNWVLKTNSSTKNNIVSIIIGVLAIIISVFYPNNYYEIVFILGLSNIISSLIFFSEKKIILQSYKNRSYASIVINAITLILSPNIQFSIILLILNILFILNFISFINQKNIKNSSIK